MADSDNIPHIALLPSSGMGHLTPFLRLAASLVTNHNCKLTLITIQPTVSLSESQLISRFLSSFPQITPKEFHLLPFDPSTANSKDPFFLHIEAIRRSAHLLSPLLSSLSSPPLSALVTDITLASAFLRVTSQLHLPNYILFTASAKMLSLCAYFPTILESSTEIDESFQIPGSSPMPKSWVPPVLFDLSSLFTTQFIENSCIMVESNGILINTFESLERETLEALNDGKVVDGLPPVIPIGPLVPCEFEKSTSPKLKWLDGEQNGSVVYVSFGSRTAMCREQIRELGVGLVRSGCRFVWVLKDKEVDREEEENLEVVLGNELMEGVKEKGLVLKEWVDQVEILGHPSVGGFVSHCGWNSVTEAAWHGVPILAWPQLGDQRVNAAVVENSGFGVCVKNWGWGDGGVIVKGEEIGEMIREMMSDEGLRLRAAHARDEARKAKEVDGSSEKGLSRVIELCNKM
ncbi:UDP-glucuronosyl/UDP-glucosyltransferase [Macleaya cordata]|uniref:Glycosyltransferase n=1 Tax=Macleaya cordata TaxID=56857 RepID=A0A200QNX2_MACCD|nr:UDP-glucuronosyl/UDP-glucosyltransferase [Macleaya cordata]